MIARALALLAALGLGAGLAEADPVAVRLAEGSTRGFLVVRGADGTVIGHGELRQKPVQDVVEHRLILEFKDGSRREELVVFSQDRVFRLESYRLTERGPLFPAAVDLSFERKSGRYRLRTQDRKGGGEHSSAGPLDMPPDLYNGMALLLLKNLGEGERATGRMAVFTPGPRLLRMELAQEGEDTARFGGAPVAVKRFLSRLEIGGVTGVIATLIGKEPPDTRYWIVGGDVPAFARFEGAMFLNGPVWRIEMTTLEWPR